MNEIVAMIGDDCLEIPADIFMTLPSDEELSAEDSDDDDDQPSSVNHLSRAQLLAEADAKIVTASRRTKTLLADDVSDSSELQMMTIFHSVSLHRLLQQFRGNRSKVRRNKRDHQHFVYHCTLKKPYLDMNDLSAVLYIVITTCVLHNFILWQDQ